MYEQAQQARKHQMAKVIRRAQAGRYGFTDSAANDCANEAAIELQRARLAKIRNTPASPLLVRAHVAQARLWWKRARVWQAYPSLSNEVVKQPAAVVAAPAPVTIRTTIVGFERLWVDASDIGLAPALLWPLSIIVESEPGVRGTLFNRAMMHRDAENEVSHVEYRAADGAKLMVVND